MEDLNRALDKANKKSAPGADKVSYKILKLCSEKFKALLLDVYNSCWENGYFPKVWKTATIVTIPKTENASVPKDYRPISLLPCLGKTFERMINDRLSIFLEENNVLPATQFGFRKKLSAEVQLLRLTQKIHSTWNKKQNYICAFIDVKKAFDMVWRNKMKKFGVI